MMAIRQQKKGRSLWLIAIVLIALVGVVVAFPDALHEASAATTALDLTAVMYGSSSSVPLMTLGTGMFLIAIFTLGRFRRGTRWRLATVVVTVAVVGGAGLDGADREQLSLARAQAPQHAPELPQAAIRLGSAASINRHVSSGEATPVADAGGNTTNQ